MSILRNLLVLFILVFTCFPASAARFSLRPDPDAIAIHALEFVLFITTIGFLIVSGYQYFKLKIAGFAIVIYLSLASLSGIVLCVALSFYKPTDEGYELTELQDVSVSQWQD